MKTCLVVLTVSSFAALAAPAAQKTNIQDKQWTDHLGGEHSGKLEYADESTPLGNRVGFNGFSVEAGNLIPAQIGEIETAESDISISNDIAMGSAVLAQTGGGSGGDLRSSAGSRGGGGLTGGGTPPLAGSTGPVTPSIGSSRNSGSTTPRVVPETCYFHGDAFSEIHCFAVVNFGSLQIFLLVMTLLSASVFLIVIACIFMLSLALVGPSVTKIVQIVAPTPSAQFRDLGQNFQETDQSSGEKEDTRWTQILDEGIAVLGRDLRRNLRFRQLSIGLAFLFLAAATSSLALWPSSFDERATLASLVARATIVIFLGGAAIVFLRNARNSSSAAQKLVEEIAKKHSEAARVLNPKLPDEIESEIGGSKDSKPSGMTSTDALRLASLLARFGG